MLTRRTTILDSAVVQAAPAHAVLKAFGALTALQLAFLPVSGILD